MHDIDFVVTWVDGNDPAWLEQRAQYRKEVGDQSDARFRDWGLLRYWFRAVEAYAPWVRKIHFVTWGHVPTWLDTSNPKLHIVRHDEFIPEKYLPTFNSHTIELNLHRIPGLAERFVYFNDDVYLTKTTKPDFFFENGLPRDCFALDDIYFASNSIGWINGSNTAVINDHFKVRNVLKKHWKKALHPANGVKKVIKTCVHAALNPWFPGMMYGHMHMTFTKETFEVVWERALSTLDETCACRFREKTNVSPNLMRNWQLVTGDFMPKGFEGGRCFHMTDGRVQPLCRAIRRNTYHVVCINDSGRLTDLDASIETIRAAFESALPDKCSFEKQSAD